MITPSAFSWTEEESLGQHLQSRGVSRRDFVKFCGEMALILGVGSAAGPRIARALQAVKRPSVIWLQLQECTGCVESVLRTADPTIGDLLLDIVSLDYNHTLMAGAGAAVERAKTQSYSQRFGVVLHRQLSRWFAFLDQMYTPQKLFRWMDLPSRPGAVPPARMPWKLSEVFDDRQTFMWPRVEQDIALRDGTRMTWMGLIRFVLPPLTDDVLQQVIDDAVRDVRAIRARGGDVVFVRPPSAGALLETERQRVPRARAWDRLIRETETVGIHWEDHATMQGLDVPEWSHLSRASATRFTRAYVDIIVKDVPWLQARAGRWQTARVP